MLPRSQRLTTPLFREVFTSGRLVHSPFFTLKVKKAGTISRFAVSVSKKIAPNAVDRNRIRRRTYAAIRDLRTLNTPIQAVLIAKNTVDKASLQEITQELNAVFVKIGLLE